MSFYPFAWNLLILLQWNCLASKFLGHNFKVKLPFSVQMSSAQFPSDPLLENCQTCTVDTCRKQVLPSDFNATSSTVKVKLLVFENMLSTHYLKSLLLDSCLIWNNAFPFRVNVPCWFSSHVNKCQDHLFCCCLLNIYRPFCFMMIVTN